MTITIKIDFHTLEKELLRVAEDHIEEILDDIAEETKEVMQEFAPKPSGTAFGKGSHATGRTERNIVIKRTGERERWIGVPADRVPYVKYADEGRGGFSASSGKMLVWRDGHGRWHKTKSVGAMEGWHFVKQTVDYLKSHYQIKE